MKALHTGLASALLACGAMMLTSSPAQAEDSAAVSDRAELLIGDWQQGADRMVGEGEEAAIVSLATESYRADGTVDVGYRLILTGDALPEDLRTYDFTQVNNWRLEGDQLFSKPVSVEVTYVGENELGLEIAGLIQKDVLATPEDFTTLVSINADNYIARMTDGTLISMTRK